ncbi:MAG: CapA family protein [Solobacterium sp.]|nr:CapA family protein [Solobacterium sp.]
MTKKTKKRRIRPLALLCVILVPVLAIAGLAVLVMKLIGKKPDTPEEVPAEVTAEPTAEPAEPQISTAEFFFTGDALIHGTVWMDADRGNGTYDFSGIVENVGRLAEGYDLKYYNQETILGGVELGLHGYPTFNSPQEVGDAMVNMGFGLVSTANNHSLDQGVTGINRSCEYWKKQEAEHGVHMAGTYVSQEDHDKLEVYEVNGITYTFLSWTYGCNGLLPPQGQEYIVNIYTDHVEELLEQVRRANELSDIVIVAMHWGTEYYMEANDEQRELAQRLSEAGADIIVGNHPHVIQPIEWVNNGKTIVYYAMGNMVSAQIDEPNLVGMVGGITIRKITDEDGSRMELLDPRADLIYTYYDPGYVNFKVIPMKELDDAHVPGAAALYEKYRAKINEYDDSIRVGVELN